MIVGAIHESPVSKSVQTLNPSTVYRRSVKIVHSSTAGAGNAPPICEHLYITLQNFKEILFILAIACILVCPRPTPAHASSDYAKIAYFDVEMLKSTK